TPRRRSGMPAPGAPAPAGPPTTRPGGTSYPAWSHKGSAPSRTPFGGGLTRRGARPAELQQIVAGARCAGGALALALVGEAGVPAAQQVDGPVPVTERGRGQVALVLPDGHVLLVGLHHLT